MKEKAIRLPFTSVVERISDTPATGYPPPTRTVAERDIATRRRAVSSSVAENLDSRGKLTRLTRMERFR